MSNNSLNFDQDMNLAKIALNCSNRAKLAKNKRISQNCTKSQRFKFLVSLTQLKISSNKKKTT